MSAERLQNAVGEVPRREIIDALEALRHEYEHGGRGLRLAEVANGYQLRTAKEHAEFVRRLTAARPARMSRANLETLAIIAYRQPSPARRSRRSAASTSTASCPRCWSGA